MRFAFIILGAFVFVSCSKDTNYNFKYSDVIGKKFSSVNNTIEFLSQDSLIWKLTSYRDTLIHYRLKYNVLGNSISFEVKDTVRIDYIDPITDEPAFSITYYIDSFVGDFSSDSAIEATERHSYVVRPNDEYPSSMAGAELQLTYRR